MSKNINDFTLQEAVTAALERDTFRGQIEGMATIVRHWPDALKEDPRVIQWMKDNKENLNALIPPGM